MKARCLVVVNFLILSFLMQAQDHRLIDSLRKVLPTKSDSDTMKTKMLCALSFQYSYLDLDSGLRIGKYGLMLAEKQNFIHEKANLLNCIGTIYQDKADYKMALECYMQARNIVEKLNDKPMLAVIYANTSTTFNYLKDFANAKHYMFECLKICRSEKLTDRFSQSYILLGNFYHDQGLQDSSLYYLDLALNSPISDRSLVGVIHASKGLCYKALKKFDVAEKEFVEAIVVAKEVGSEYYQSEYSSSLATVYLQQKRYKEAEQLLNHALVFFKSSALKREETDAYYYLYELYNAQKNNDKALYYHVQYFKQYDSINNAETNKIARELEKKYEDEKKKAEITRLGAEKKVTEQFLTFIGIACVLIFIALGFAVYAFINKRKANIELHALHHEVSEQKNELFEKNKNITDSILYAQRIQKALLSSRAYIKDNVNDFFIIHKPKDIVSGDFYWAQRSGDDFFFMLADCTGHGVPGAFMSLLGISYLNELVVGQKNRDTDKILNGLRASIVLALTDNTYEMKDGMDGVLCRFNFKKLQLQYSAANNGIVIIRDKVIIELNGDKMPVGRSPRDKENFTANEFDLKKNDMVYLFTDGFPDQFGGPKGKKLKQRSLKEMLLKWHELPLEKQETSLNDYFSDWKKDLEQIDDVTLVGFKI